MERNKIQERIGQVRYDINTVSELKRLANEDEIAAQLLHQAGAYRNAIYLFLQAMEKMVRAEIFLIVDPANRFFREHNRHHSLKMSFDFFAQIVSSDLLKRAELREHIDTIVPPSLQHEALNNGLRYPWYSERFSQYNISDFDQTDAEIVRDSLANLQQLFRGIERYR